MSPLKRIVPISSKQPKSKATAIPKAPEPVAISGRPFPDYAQPTVAPRGEAQYDLGQDPEYEGGPGPQPTDFPGSGAEWVWFWASRKYFEHQDHIPPRHAPYDGGENWSFADPIAQGITTTRLAAETTPDFVYLQGGAQLIVRIEGYHWHAGAGAAQQARDLYLMNHEADQGDNVVRVNDDEYMDDITGNKAIRLLAQILEQHEPTGELQGGTVRAPRYADFQSVGVFA